MRRLGLQTPPFHTLPTDYFLNGNSRMSMIILIFTSIRVQKQNTANKQINK